MTVKSLELRDFRNYNMLDIHFDKGTNILYGDNAQGKTNVLEAIYLSGTTKSHKGSRDKEMIRFGENEAHIRTVVEKNEMEYQIDMHLKKNKPKGIAINHIPIRKASELFGILNVVFFSPEDLNIIKNGPSERRRFVDMELSQISRLYLNNLSNYHRTINQRNRLLKDIYYNDSLKETLDIWDMQLAEYGNKIIKERKKFIKQVNEIISKIHKKITGNREDIEVIYEPNTGNESFEDVLKKYRERDLKMTQITKDKPVLLLDDVLSELDKHRQNYLLDSIDEIQTLITCTGVDEFVNHRFSINKVFYVHKGKVVKEN